MRLMVERHPEVPLIAAKSVDLFAALAHAIVNQQLSGKVAAVIFARLQALFPRRRLRAETLLTLPEARLRTAGLSWNKIRSLRDLATRMAQGELPKGAALRTLPDDTLMERLTQVHGIGPWTVQMLLIFKLARPDVFPATDLGILKGFQKLHGRRQLPTAKRVARHAERLWKPYRTLAAWYLWRAVDETIVAPVNGAPMWKAEA